MNKISKAYSTNGGMDNDVPIVYVGGIIQELVNLKNIIKQNYIFQTNKIAPTLRTIALQKTKGGW